MFAQDIISTHAPLARCNPLYQNRLALNVKFLLTHLLRGATLALTKYDISLEISTHAPLARCNSVTFADSSPSIISTHAPLARCNYFCHKHLLSAKIFLLTHLLRGATYILHDGKYIEDISTHAPLARCNGHLK